jgi:hypothetical protein
VSISLKKDSAVVNTFRMIHYENMASGLLSTKGDSAEQQKGERRS